MEGEIIGPGTYGNPPPAPAPPVIEGEFVPSAESTPAPTTRQTSFRVADAQASTQAANGEADFGRGITSLRNGNYTSALESFESAANAEPTNALYRYHQALALFELGGAEAGRDALEHALRLERDRPIAGWGRQMERIQGRARMWIETARREAGLAR